MALTQSICDIEARTQHGLPSGRPRTCRVHPRLLRIVWAQHHGVPWPEKMYACHHCDEPRCANPEHIFPGTCSDNAKDAISKKGNWGPFQNGEKHSMAKLTWEQVFEARRRFANGENQTALAEEYGVKQSTLSKAISGKRWRGD